MYTMHSSKTKTCEEYDPRTHVQYQLFLKELQQQMDTLTIARKELSQSEIEVKIRQEELEFSLPLYRNIFGLYLCDVKVNNTPCRFIIDTGAQISSLRYDKMKRLNIEPTNGKIEIGAASGTHKELHGCVLDSFVFGSMTYEHLPVLCLDKDDFSMRFGEIDIIQFDGILGWDILRNLDFELDNVSKQIKVLKNKFKFSYQNMVSGMFPIFLVKDEYGNLLKMGFDSGSKRSWFSKESAERLKYPMSGTIQAMGFGVHGVESMQLALYSKGEFYVFKAHIAIHNIMSGNCNILPDIVVDGVFGNEIFKNRRIRIINSKGMVLLV